MRSGWLILLLVIAGGANLLGGTPDCNSHPVMRDHGHGQSPSDDIRLHPAQSPCGLPGHAHHPTDPLGSSMCNSCLVPAETLALGTEPYDPASTLQMIARPLIFESFTSELSRPPAF